MWSFWIHPSSRLVSTWPVCVCRRSIASVAKSTIGVGRVLMFQQCQHTEHQLTIRPESNQVPKLVCPRVRVVSLFNQSSFCVFVSCVTPSPVWIHSSCVWSDIQCPTLCLCRVNVSDMFVCPHVRVATRKSRANSKPSANWRNAALHLARNLRCARPSTRCVCSGEAASCVPVVGAGSVTAAKRAAHVWHG